MEFNSELIIIMYKIQLPACLQPPPDMNTILLYLVAYIGCLCLPVLT